VHRPRAAARRRLVEEERPSPAAAAAVAEQEQEKLLLMIPSLTSYSAEPSRASRSRKLSRFLVEARKAVRLLLSYIFSSRLVFSSLPTRRQATYSATTSALQLPSAGSFAPPLSSALRRRALSAAYRKAMPFGATHSSLRSLAQYATQSFFSRIHIDGEEHVPLEGPVIALANHHNSAVDVSLKRCRWMDWCWSGAAGARLLRYKEHRDACAGALRAEAARRRRATGCEGTGEDHEEAHNPLGIFAAESELAGRSCSAAQCTHLLLGLGQQADELGNAEEDERCMLLKLALVLAGRGGFGPRLAERLSPSPRRPNLLSTVKELSRTAVAS